MSTSLCHSSLRSLITVVALCAGVVGLTSCHRHQAAPADSNTDTNAAATTAAGSPASAGASTTPTASASSAATPSINNAELQLIRDAYLLDTQGKLDESLAKVNQVIQMNPKNTVALILRGGIYSRKRTFDLAQKDYETVLQLDAQNATAKFNIAELKFMQKDYDGARGGFSALQPDSNLGDLATYKVFLCDLLGGHDDAAKKEFDDFNNVGGNASFYFANVAWFVFHKDPESARSWLASASRIYPPQKFGLYASSLHDLGYLPLPPPTQSDDATAPAAPTAAAPAEPASPAAPAVPATPATPPAN
jgi:tetratricopeptide (TPR) repeat protein